MKRYALVTGASRGIGRAIAIELAKDGCAILLNYKSNHTEAEATKQMIEAAGGEAELMPFDVSQPDAINAALDQWFAAHPDEYIDVLVNNAGLALGMDKEYAGVEEDYDTMIDTNITALLMITRLVVPGMIARGKGHIINIGSVAGDAAYPGGSVYCATKAAVKVLSDGLRMDLVDTPLRVTNVKPGLVETNFSVTRFGGDKERADKVYQGIKPLTGDDIADVVYYAASAPEHVQIAEVLVLATHQASGSLVYRR